MTSVQSGAVTAMEERRLLQETVTAFLSPAWDIVSVETRALASGMSEAPVSRHELLLACPGGKTRSLRLVTKSAALRERRTLAWLTAQHQPNVPFSHTTDLTTDASALVCMQDVGDARRPTSLEPITEAELEREADGLAAIHLANRRRAQELAWLPRIDRSYFAEEVIARWWRPPWQRVLQDNEFRSAFRSYLAAVEAAVEPMVAEMAALAREEDSLTLAHTDINPSNVLVQDGRPYYIDWQVAHYGPFYLDLPHHFCTRQQAEHYRRALAASGHDLAASEFEERYRAAARCIGFRYIWWTLDNWRRYPQGTAWVLHYIRLILGGALPGTD
jgi:thiamine kinase-like enzyme